MITEVVIVGKGMAALVLAYLLKQEGINYVLLDRKTRVKAFDLAETLPPSALPLLQSIGLLELFEKHSIRKTYGYHSLWGTDRLANHNFYFHHPYKYGLKIDKRNLLADLEQKTGSKNIPYEYLIQLKKEAGEFQIVYQQNGIKNTLQTPIIVDATGRSRAVLKLLNIPSIDYDGTLSFTCHLARKKHPDLKHDVLVESFKEGWGLVSGLKKTQNVISIFTHRESPIFHSVSSFQNWKTILKETKYLKHFLSDDSTLKVKGKQANSSRPQKIAGTGWLAIGDAALAFDPLCSHGISNAIYTAKKAAAAIVRKTDFTDYDKSLQDIFHTYLKSKEHIYRQEKRWQNEAFWIKQKVAI